MTRSSSLPKPEPPARWFHMLLCPDCRAFRSAVEVGEGAEPSVQNLLDSGYVRGPGLARHPVKFVAHAEGCVGRGKAK